MANPFDSFRVGPLYDEETRRHQLGLLDKAMELSTADLIMPPTAPMPGAAAPAATPGVPAPAPAVNPYQQALQDAMEARNQRVTNQFSVDRALTQATDARLVALQQQAEQQANETLNNPFFRVGDTLGDVAGMFLSPIYFLKGEARPDLSGRVRSGARERLDELDRLREANIYRLNQSRVERDKSMENVAKASQIDFRGSPILSQSGEYMMAGVDPFGNPVSVGTGIQGLDRSQIKVIDGVMYRYNPVSQAFDTPVDPSELGRNAAESKAEQDLGAARTDFILKQPQLEGAVVSLESKAEIMDDFVDQALALVQGYSTGAGGALQFVPGTEPRELRNLLTSIKANVGFNALQEMRNNSPTGGALGQVAIQELDALQSVLGSLDQYSTKEQLTDSLERIRSETKRVAEAARNQYTQHRNALLPQDDKIRSLEEELFGAQ